MQNKKLDWPKLLCSDRLHEPQTDCERTDFERDYDKIIFSAYFRRLQNKTQLFPLPKSDKIHSRLTHSLEVASVGRSLGNLLSQKLKSIDNQSINSINDIPTIISAACLFHDIGNPAFGHSGEKAISRYFKLNKDRLIQLGASSEIIEELCNFEGNAQGFRIITFEKDLNLTYAVIATYIKYPRTFDNKKSIFKKHGIGSSEFKKFEEIFQKLNLTDSKHQYIRHPLTFLVEAADDICNTIIDLEDSVKIKIIEYKQAKDILTNIITLNNKNFDPQILENIPFDKRIGCLRALAIKALINLTMEEFSKHYQEIITGEYSELINNDNNKLYGLLDKIKTNTRISANNSDSQCPFNELDNLIKNNAYNFEPVLKIELTGFDILFYFLNIFINSIIFMHIDKTELYPTSQYWNEIKANSEYAKKLVKIIPKDYINYDKEKGTIGSSYNVTLDEAILKVVDFVAGMTDTHAIKLYKRIKGMDLLR